MSVAIKIFIGIGLAFTVILYLIFGPILLVSSICDTVFYLSESNNTTQIEATVTLIDETSDVDSGSEYKIYVSYEYDNKSYKDIYWRTVGSKSKYSVGDNVNINVFNSKPSDIKDLGGLNYIGWAFPLLVTVVPIVAIIKYPPENLKITIKTKK